MFEYESKSTLLSFFSSVIVWVFSRVIT